MTSAPTYALLSAGAYSDIRRLDDNEVPIPARVYRGPGGEIVVAYASTQAGNTEVA